MATTIPSNVAQFSTAELSLATGGQIILHGLEVGCGVTTDTRLLRDGAIFVALRGEHFDAHDFLDQAVQLGAAILVVERGPKVDQLATNLMALSATARPSLLAVPDTLLALGDLAQCHRKRFSTKIVAIVGSAGKTTTRSVISSLLSVVAPELTHSTLGNLNNRIGVPMTLFGLMDHHAFGVVELGTNCPGEVALLAQMTRPQAAVLTLIDLEHTEGLGDLDGVEAEESAIFQYLSPQGIAIGYGEDARVLRQVMKAPCALRSTYGERDERDLQIVRREILSAGQVELTLKRANGTQIGFRSPLIGRAGALAAAAGVAAVEFLLDRPLTASECETGLARAGEPGRHTLVALEGQRWLVDDSYNSNPASVANSIETGSEIARRAGGRLWLVLGEMLELGTLAAEAHREMGELVLASACAGVFFVQGEAKHAYEVCLPELLICKFAPSSSSVAAELAPLVQPGDVIVVKASRGVRAERVVQGLTSFFGLATALGSPDLENGLESPPAVFSSP